MLLTEPEHRRSDPRGGTGGEIEGGVARRGEDRFGLRPSRDNLPREIEEMPKENLSSPWAEDDEPDDLEPFRQRMREHGLSEDEVEEACKLARDHVRRRGSNGRDRHADDFFPINRMKGGPGGRFGGERHSLRKDGSSEVEAIREYGEQISRGEDRRRTGRDQMKLTTEPPENKLGAIVDHGLDARRRRDGRDRQAIDEIHRQLRRFGSDEAGARPDRERGASDAAPSSAARSRFASRFPDGRRIGDASHDGELPPHADRIGGF